MSEDGPVRIGAIPRWTKVSPGDVREVYPIVDLLMGAAWADGNIDLHERDKVREVLMQLLDTDDLPLSLEAYIASFEPERFDLAKTVSVVSRTSRRGSAVAWSPWCARWSMPTTRSTSTSIASWSGWSSGWR